MRRNTREPDARGLSALLALRPRAPARAAPVRRRLPARLARPPAPRPRALVRRPARRVPRRARGHLPGPGVARRAARRPAVAGPHAATPAADDGGRAAGVAGRAAAPVAPGPAAARARVLGRAAARLPPAAPALRTVDAPAGGAA